MKNRYAITSVSKAEFFNYQGERRTAAVMASVPDFPKDCDERAEWTPEHMAVGPDGVYILWDLSVPLGEC